MRRLLIVVIGSCALLSLHGPAFAHAIVRETTPASDRIVAKQPTYVQMRFNEGVEVGFGGIRVFSSGGERVDVGRTEYANGRAETIRTRVKNGLKDGTYTVSWRVVSADGHPIAEAFVFHIGEPGAKPRGIADDLAREVGSRSVESGVATAARWLVMASLALVVGAAMFRLFVWPKEVVNDGFERSWKRLLTWSGGLLLLATLVSFVAFGAVSADVSLFRALGVETLKTVIGTRYGIVALTRIGLVAVLAVWLTVRGARAWGSSRSRFATGTLAVALGWTIGTAGHASATSPVWFNLTADGLHVLAASTWLGGLVVLLSCALPATSGDRALAARSVIRFSDVALVSVSVLVATGALRAWIEVGAWRGLTGSSYGAVLLTKLGVFVPLLALGFVNNRWVKPRLRDVSGDPGRALGVLRRTVRTEIVLGLAVLALTAFLVNLAPSRVSLGLEGPLVQDLPLGKNNLNLVVDPNRAGSNEVHLIVVTPFSTPAEVDEMQVLFRNAEHDIGPIEGEAKRLAPGHFVVQGRQLSIPGEWELEVIARYGPFDEDRASIDVRVNG